MRASFDIGGVLSKHPQVFQPLIEALVMGGVEVFVITDMPDHNAAVQLLHNNGFSCIAADHVLCADYATHGERCKQVLVEEHGIGLHVDDFPGYVANGSCVNLFVWPNPDLPYYADDFKTPDEFQFGRVRPKKRGN